MLNHPYAQTGTIIELREKDAVLQLEDGQKLHWPKNLLPPEAKKDTQVRVIIHDKQTDEEERQRLARTLLNEIVE